MERSPPPPPPPAAPSRVRPGLETAALLGVFLFLHALAGTGQVALADGDEYCRTAFTFEWARRPFFADPSHVWPSGQFVLLGALYRLVGDLRPVVAATALLGTAATVLLCARIARRLWDDPAAGFLAGLVTAANPVLLVVSCGASAEVFALPALLAGLDAWLAGLQERSERRYLAAAAWIGFGTTFRFEVWYAAVLLGAFLLLRLRRPRGSVPPLAGCALLALFPACWMISSWASLGSPFRFAVDRARAVEGEAHPYDFSSPFDSVLFYARGLAEKHGPVLLLVACGVLLAWRKVRARAIPLAAAWAAFAATAMLVASQAGMTARYPPRYVLFLLLPTLPFAGGALAALWRAAAARGPATRAAMLAGLGLVALASADLARRRRPDAWGADPVALALAVRLEREHDAHRPSSVWLFPREARLGVDARDLAWRPWMFAYHTNRPSDLFAIRDEADLAERLRSSGTGTRFLLRRPLPEEALRERARPVEVVPPYEVWEVAGTSPR
jgi:dolichyl-phosphate-mannose-protein mannosyltransferase